LDGPVESLLGIALSAIGLVMSFSDYGCSAAGLLILFNLLLLLLTLISKEGSVPDDDVPLAYL
jgi:hypothetical protein